MTTLPGAPPATEMIEGGGEGVGWHMAGQALASARMAREVRMPVPPWARGTRSPASSRVGLAPG